MKPKFNTIYNLPTFNGTEAGTELVPTYQLSIDENGAEYLEKVGTENLQAKIQSHLEETDLNLIIKKLIESGIDPNEYQVKFTDEVVDCVVPKDFHTIAQAAIHKEDNEALIKKYEAELAKLKAEKSETKTESEVKQDA